MAAAAWQSPRRSPHRLFRSKSGLRGASRLPQIFVFHAGVTFAKGAPREVGCLPHADYWNGAVAQMGERVVRNDEVRGSIPLGSTSN
jgi:hypothetical protein